MSDKCLTLVELKYDIAMMSTVLANVLNEYSDPAVALTLTVVALKRKDRRQ